MTHEPVRVVFRFARDPVLLSVIRSAVQFEACHAGLDTETGATFAMASEDVCRETFSKLTDSDGLVEVTLDTFHDRIEIAICCHGQQMPPIGPETFAFADALGEGAGGLGALELLSRVDRVLYGAADGTVRTTLVKYLQHGD